MILLCITFYFWISNGGNLKVFYAKQKYQFKNNLNFDEYQQQLIWKNKHSASLAQLK